MRVLSLRLVDDMIGLPKTSGVGSNLYCVLELDNSRLETQGVHRAANPTWNKMINFEIKVKW